MFDRFIRLAEARRALSEGRFERVLALVSDPILVSDRRAASLRERALDGLMLRARKRANGDGWSMALADLSRVLAAEPEYDGARTLKARMRERIDESASAARAAGDLLQEARRLVAEGELEAAAEQCRAAHDLHVTPVEEAAVARLIETRRAAAVEQLKRGAAALRDGSLDVARQCLIEARAQDRTVEGAAHFGPKLAARLADTLAPKLEELIRADDPAGALALLQQQQRELPEIANAPAMQRFWAKASASLGREVQRLLESGELEAAVQALTGVDPDCLAGLAQPVREAADAVARGLEQRERGDFDGAVEALGQAAAALSSSTLRRRAKAWQADQVVVRQALDRARALGEAGQLLEARQELLALVERWPLHAELCRELEVLDQGAADVERRLAQARAAAAEGRLREAAALLVALAVPGPRGEEARVLLKEIRARTDLVQRGLGQVRRTVHGRASSSAQGLRHCVMRLDQLAKVQTDEAEIASLRDALEAEVSGLQLLDEAAAAVQRGDAAATAEALRPLGEVRAGLLRADRLDARMLDLSDDLTRRVEDAVGAGRLDAADHWLQGLEAVSAAHADIARRVRELRTQAEQRRATAEAAATNGRRALAARNLGAAESCVEEARQAWADGPAVRALEQRLIAMRDQEAAVGEAERLASEQDFAAAHRELDRMSTTPSMLRTRIFDLKQSLARAQGLEGAFLLRVDEGGEFLVVRGDTITVGNVRDGHADLPVLANISGRHARIVRSMSFHGGMQDRIVAERGELYAGGERVIEHRLNDGDRVRLGSVLDLTYRVPSKRSLTAMLTLGSGFQVAGTDKVLLMKDRGRDGRILIGPVPDAHVRVPHDQPEIELFTDADGRVRVRFEGRADLGGRPISGEHPVEAGAVVRCGEVAFVLQPLRP
ncbi:MAG: hypothetical protein AAF628_00395 [Planctomycetota bacterium]